MILNPMINRSMIGLLLATSSAVMATEPGSTYDWTGAYVGVNLGSAWTGSELTANHSQFLSDSQTYSEQLNSTAVNPGLQLGYLKQLPGNWVVGGEGDFSYPATDSQYQSPAAIDGSGDYDQFIVHNKVQGSLRLRAGYALDRFLPFVTAGVSFASLGFNYNNEAGQSEAIGTTTTQTGWVLGGGLEYGILTNLSVRTEYLYTDYGKALNQNILTVGLDDVNGGAHATLYTHVARAAVNYRF
ncbi:MAG: outer membrane protein [Methylococcaceae bacterium]